MEATHEDIQELIKDGYTRVLLRTGKEPISPFSFAEDVGISEQDFYSEYRTFKSVEKDIWADMMRNVKNALEEDAEFPSYTGREKTLALFYTLIEVYKQNRSMLLFRMFELPRQNIKPWFLEHFRKEFMEMVATVLDEAKETEEVVARPVISDKYGEGLWIQLLYITRVWVNDESEEYQITDAGIEKSVNLCFELLKKGPIDMLIDFVKFAYQNKAY